MKNLNDDRLTVGVDQRLLALDVGDDLLLVFARFYLFSREAVSTGALETFAASLPKPTGKAKQCASVGGGYKSVDEDFLAELDELREELAQSLKLRNPQLTGDDLTEACTCRSDNGKRF